MVTLEETPNNFQNNEQPTNQPNSIDYDMDG
jgi:hypothetical protein